MNSLPIGLTTRSLRQPLRKALVQAAEIGAEGVEFDARNELRLADFTQTALRQFRKLLEDLRLGVLAISFPTRRGLDDPEDLERRVLAIREAMSFAYKIGAHVVIGRAGNLAEEEPSQALVDSLTLLAAHGEHCGARFAFLSGEDPHKQRALIQRVGQGTIGAALHPATLIGAGHEVSAAAETLGADALHVYASDAVREAPGRAATEVQLGRGEADFPAVLAALEERDYRGALSIERNGAGDPAVEIGDAIAYLRAL